MDYWKDKRAIITGGSSGLGRAVAQTLAKRGARVAIVARNQQQLDVAHDALQFPLPPGEGSGEGSKTQRDKIAISADVTQPLDVARMAETIRERWGGVDFFCHAAGRSMRGDVLTTTPDQFRALWEINTLAAIQCIHALAASLRENRGHIALIGSLASKVAPRYLGAYPTSKFPLAALAQQLRLELGPQGVHTLLVCPGPIARDETGPRYADQSADVPATAALPAAGANVTAISPDDLAYRILRACERRDAELIVPAKARLLFALSQLSPRLGDWLLEKNMKRK
jgi:NAD(P)-dependent dehydrogenase (short-subunit alcohol dehydrogenase family)